MSAERRYRGRCAGRAGSAALASQGPRRTATRAIQPCERMGNIAGFLGGDGRPRAASTGHGAAGHIPEPPDARQGVSEASRFSVLHPPQLRYLEGCPGSACWEGDTLMARALLCGLVAAGLAFGAAPCAVLTPEQAAQDRAAFALYERAHKEWKAEKKAQAVASMRESVAGCERLYGWASRQ